MGKEEYMQLEQVDGDDEEAVVEAWLVRPQLLLPAAQRWLAARRCCFLTG